MSFVDISMLGDKKLAKKLKKIDIKMQKKIVKGAIKDAAQPILVLAKAYAPVDSGKLKNSLKLKMGAKQSKRGSIGVRIETGTREQLGIDADDKYFYPAVLEFKVKSFLRRAIDKNPDGVRRDIGRNIRAALLTAGR